MLITAVILMPTVGLVTWAWFAIAQTEEELRCLNGFEGMHFETGPEAAQDFVACR